MAKPFPKLKNRFSIFTAFVILILIIITVGFIGASGLNRLIHITNRAKDQLIPAVEAAKIAEKLYQNRLNIEEHIAVNSPRLYVEIENNINKNNKQIDSLMVIYSEIYTLRDRDDNLLKYRNQLNKYRGLEKQVIQLSRKEDKAQAQVLFLGQSVDYFQKLIEPIHQITDEHIKEGELQYTKAKDLANFIKMILYLAIGIAFVVVVIIGTIAGYTYMND
jgi:methyl-accepting chemotaxis protein